MGDVEELGGGDGREHAERAHGNVAQAEDVADGRRHNVHKTGTTCSMYVSENPRVDISVDD